MGNRIRLSEDDEKILNKQIIEISKEEIKKNWEEFMKFTPIPSGSDQEEEAIQFILHTLKGYGLIPEIHQYDAYLSDPKWAKLEILEPQKIEIQCTPYRQVGTTGPEGIEGEAIYLPPDEIGYTDCYGKIVLLEQKTSDDWMGLQHPLLLKLQKMGVKGLIVIEQDNYMATVIHQRADFSVSGNPTPDNFHLIATIPATVSVCNQDGQLLKAFAKKSPFRVRLVSIVETSWKKNSLLAAQICGNREPEKFLLVAGHVDTPPFSPGMTDNASGVVALLELARVLNKYREQLGRSVRFLFWTGHEIGRYAGSTWYNDAFWHDIRYNCVGAVNIDSPGVKGATEYRTTRMTEVQEAVIDSVKAVTGIEIEGNTRWPSRAGDASFWGTGIPYIGIIASRSKEDSDPFVNGSGGAWWWHSPWDSFDRGDINVLTTDIKVNLNYIFRMTNCHLLPINFVSYAKGIVTILEDLQVKADKIKRSFNLQPVIEEAKRFRELSLSLENAVQKNINQGKPEVVIRELNQCLMWVSRFINPITHSDTDKTNQMDMYLFGARPFPRLQEILKLAQMPLPQESEFKILKTKLLRNRNYVVDGLYLANELIERTLNKIEKV